MRKIVKNTLIIALLYTISTGFGHAFDMDETVNDEIRKNYNPGQLINDVGIKESALEIEIKEQAHPVIDSSLPALPNISKEKNATIDG